MLPCKNSNKPATQVLYRDIIIRDFNALNIRIHKTSSAQKLETINLLKVDYFDIGYVS